MVGIDAGLRERVELRVGPDQFSDGRTGVGLGEPVGNLADDLVVALIAHASAWQEPARSAIAVSRT